MATQWFQVDAATGAVHGWGRSSGDTLPDAPDGALIVATTDDQIAQYTAMANTAQLAALDAPVTLANGQLVAPVDHRLFVRVAADKAVVQRGDSVTVTVTALNPDASVNTGFNQTVYYGLPDGRIYAYPFVSGVASRAISAPQSGRFRLQSTAEVRFESPVDILVVE